MIKHGAKDYNRAMCLAAEGGHIEFAIRFNVKLWSKGLWTNNDSRGKWRAS